MDKEGLSQELRTIQSAFEACLSSESGSTDHLVQQLEVVQRNIEGPSAYLARLRLRPFVNMCKMMAIEMGLLGAIVARKGDSITVEDLAAEIGQDELLILRILRELSVNGICTEVAASTYCSNEAAELLNTPAQTGATRIFVDALFPIGGKLVTQIRSAGIQRGAEQPGGGTPFEFTYRQPMFDFLKSSPEHKRAFDDYMIGRKSGIRKSWFEIYPAADILPKDPTPDSATIVDIGGGVGADLVNFQMRYEGKGTFLVLEDLPETLERVCNLPEGIKIVPYNFFTMEQPIEGAYCYLLLHVLHDWANPQAQKILTSTAKAMRARNASRLLIQDMVLPDNRAGWRHAAQDINMLVLQGGMERTLAQWERLLESAGLHIIKVWKESEFVESIIEVGLKE